MKVLRKVKWNTGRQYGPDGQPITAWLLELTPYLDVILFRDDARMIDGVIDIKAAHGFSTDYSVESHTMHSYDYSQYYLSLHLSSSDQKSLGAPGEYLTTFRLFEMLRELGEETC